MMHAERCPICGGIGEKESIDSNHNGDFYRSETSVFTKKEICNGCKGQGWITVADNIPYKEYDYETGTPYWETIKTFKSTW